MSKKHILLKILFLIVFLQTMNSLSIDTNDLLNGDGLFSSGTLGSFISDSSHNTSFLLKNTTNILKLVKPVTSQVSYTHGLIRTFNQSQPYHISFQFSSTSTQTQDTNFRIMDNSDNYTVILFRAGRGGFVRVNQNQMVTFYNDSITKSDTSIITMKVDLLLHWKQKSIDIFINNKYSGHSKFFQEKIQKVNTVLVYNLYQSTSYWKNFVICSQICYNFNTEYSLIFKSISIIGIILLLF